MLTGILFSITASLFFGVMYYLSTHLVPLSGEGIFGFRIWGSLSFILAAIPLFNKRSEFVEFLQRIRRGPYLILVLLATSFVTGSQMWLFLWAPNNGSAIDVSVGYLLMPIAMVAVGRFFFKEPISHLKLGSILFACLGVLSSLITVGSISWATLMVLTGYPLYFGLRKVFNISHLSSFVCEILLLLPVAAYFIVKTDMDFILTHNPNFYLWLALLSLVSGTALISYVIASSILPMNVLGLLGYFEPMSMLIVSFIIGETLDKGAYWLMACLSISVGLMLLDGALSIRKQRKRSLLPEGERAIL